MLESKQHFNEISVNIFEGMIGEFCKTPTEIAPFIRGRSLSHPRIISGVQPEYIFARFKPKDKGGG